MSRLTSWFRRNRIVIAIGVIVFCAMTSAYMGALSFQRQNQQIRAQQDQITTLQVLAQQTKTINEQIAASSKKSSEEVAGINKHLDCIAIFFSQPDRAQKSITDIDRCIVSTNYGQPEQLDSSNAAAFKTQQPSPKTTQNTGSPRTPATNPPVTTPKPDPPAEEEKPFLQRLVNGTLKGVQNILGL